MRRGRCGRFFLAAALASAQGSLVSSAPTEPLSGPSEAQTKSSATRAAAGPSADVPDVNPLPSGSGAGGLGPGAPSAPPAAEGSRIFGSPPGEEALHGLPINLASALQLAGVSPLDIAAATVQVQQGLAVLLQAKVLWVPTLNAGVDYYRHDGVQQNLFTGALFQKGVQKLFVGGGPSLNVGVTDAVYEPLAARRVVAAREANVQTARNDVLLQVSQAYFTLQDARGRLVGVDATIERARRLVNFTIGLAPALIAPLEINRSKAELQSLLQSREIALRDWQVASAALANVLLLDPETLLEPVEPPFVQVTLISAEQTVADLVPIAINSRPEIASQRELLAAANQRLKQEKKRPFLPNLILTSPATGTGLLAAGNLSGGPNAGLGANAHSAFFEVAAVWQLQNAGIGNIGLIRQRRAEQDLAAIEVTRALFRVRADVTQALARLQTARARVPVTEMGLWQATESADKNFIGLRETTRPAGALLNLIVRPQEVVAALIALNTAFEQYAAAVNDYNAAQFELYRAVGQPAQWVTSQASQLPLIARDARPTPSPAPGTNAPVAPIGAPRP
jgi:outer membrane protein TolC